MIELNTALSYKAYNQNNYKQIEQISRLSEEHLFNIDVVSKVLPFKTNNYVIEKLINWDNYQDDPLFILTFPQKGMLSERHFNIIADLLKNNASDSEIKETANKIRLKLNPHSSGQLEHNVPSINNIKLTGVQHKYRETVLFFPSQGQTCHAYCTFCFRWPQFVGIDELKFASREIELFKKYVTKHTEISDVLFTGGDPMVMKASKLKSYIEPLLTDDCKNVQSIRIGTKALAFWPYRFINDDDSEEILDLFRYIKSKGRNLAIMAHFCHPNELDTDEVKIAIENLLKVGAQIRTQSPVLKHINDKSEIWSEMWRKQVNLNCIPYYMFVPRDTGARNFFAVPLVRAWNIFRKSYQKVSGICRTVRGPIMSATPGKIQVLGVSEIHNDKKIVMRMIQGRNPDWAARPFFAEYDEKALWISDLKPAFDEPEFFFETQLEKKFHSHLDDSEYSNFE